MLIPDGIMLAGFGFIGTGSTMFVYALWTRLCTYMDGQADMYRGFER